MNREKLAGMIGDAPVWRSASKDEACAQIADHLIAHGVTVQGWIPVTERLPKRGEFVLFSYAKENRNPTMYAKNTMAVGRYDQKMFLVEGCSVKVTHWMPLPEPPKED